MIRLASRLGAVQPSASASVSAAAKALVATGRDVIDLGLGEPDFDTPAHIVVAAGEAAASGDTRYPPTGGTGALKAAVVSKMLRDHSVECTPDQVIVSNGAKQVLYNALVATLEEGDEVLLCAPFFGSYESMTLLLGGVPIPIACGAADGFLLRPEQLEAVITERTRWIILNHPSNPTGATYTATELQALGEVLERHPQVNVMSDEIYEHIVFDGREFVSFATACPQLAERTLIVNGVSKAYAMTGWRIGYGVGPRELIGAMTTVQSQATSGACSIAQAAAVAALNGPQDHVADFRAAFERRRNLVVDALGGVESLDLAAPGGAFYAYIGCERLIGKQLDDGTTLTTDVEVAAFLLDVAGVATVPGAAYGMSPYFRISTASSDAVLSDALERIVRAVS